VSEGDILSHPHFTCMICGADNVLEVDASEGFPQSFVWDCARCCRAHEIEVRREADGLVVRAEAV
jgi:transcription elongation factor Elf1